MRDWNKRDWMDIIVIVLIATMLLYIGVPAC